MIGVRQTTLNNQTKGKRKLSLSVVCSVLEKLPEVSAEWLMRGIGSMDTTSDSTTNEDYQSLRDSYNRLLGENAVLREQLGLSASTLSEKTA